MQWCLWTFTGDSISGIYARGVDELIYSPQPELHESSQLHDSWFSVIYHAEKTLYTRNQISGYASDSTGGML